MNIWVKKEEWSDARTIVQSDNRPDGEGWQQIFNVEFDINPPSEAKFAPGSIGWLTIEYLIRINEAVLGINGRPKDGENVIIHI